MSETKLGLRNLSGHITVIFIVLIEVIISQATFH